MDEALVKSTLQMLANQFNVTVEYLLPKMRDYKMAIVCSADDQVRRKLEDYKNVAEAFRTYKYIENEPPKPNHDLVEVVRCKNCRWGRESCGNIECSVDADVNLPSEYHGYDWFCPKGERRNDG